MSISIGGSGACRARRAASKTQRDPITFGRILRSTTAAALLVGAAPAMLAAVLIGGPAVAQEDAQSDDAAGDKPDFDGSEDMGIKPADVEDLGKDSADRAAPSRRAPRAAPAPRTRRAPIESGPSERQAERPAPRDRGVQPTADRRSARRFLAGRPYVWGSLGWVAAEDTDLSNGLDEAELGAWLHYGAAAGWHFNNGLRAELEVSYFEVDIDTVMGVSTSGDIEALTGMFNVYYELPIWRRIKPYLGGGIGFAGIDATVGAPGSFSDDNTVLAYQFIGGTAVTLTDNAALTFDYRYFAADNASYDGVDADLTAHKFLAGLRYTFGAR